MIAALKDEKFYVKWAAAGALGNIKDARAVEPLVMALKDQYDVRKAAAEALGKIKDTRDVEPLVMALTDKEKFVGQVAAETCVNDHVKLAVPHIW